MPHRRDFNLHFGTPPYRICPDGLALLESIYSESGPIPRELTCPACGNVLRQDAAGIWYVAEAVEIAPVGHKGGDEVAPLTGCRSGTYNTQPHPKSHQSGSVSLPGCTKGATREPRPHRPRPTDR